MFQPHRYTRTRALLEEFGGAFFLADRVIVTEIYAAGEPALPGVGGQAVADSLVRHGHPWVRFEGARRDLVRVVREMIEPGDIVVTLGAGDVFKIGEELARSGARRKRA